MNYSLDKGVFIAFEGTDGAGKSTVARATYDRIFQSHSALHYIDKNRPPVPTGYTEFHMSRLREVLWDYPDNAPLEQLGDKHWMSLITAWFQATDHAAITPLINSGASCISDGWHYKYLARFLLKSTDLAENALAMFSTIRKPDFVIFLDVDPALAAQRKGQRTYPTTASSMPTATTAKRRSGCKTPSTDTIPCRSCRRLRSFDLDLKTQNQKIAAFGSSYRGRVYRVRIISCHAMPPWSDSDGLM